MIVAERLEGLARFEAREDALLVHPRRYAFVPVPTNQHV